MKNHNIDNLKTPLVSIIIPAYNSEKFILNTIITAINQDYKNYEILVIDDGSIDGTAFVIKNIMDKYKNIKIISIENGGVSRARNMGINYAKGDFICFLDSDDSLEHNFLSSLLPKIILNNSDVQLCGYYKHFSNGFNSSPLPINNDNLLHQYIFNDISIHIGSMLIKKSFLENNKILFDERLKLGEDILFICTVISLGVCGVTSKHLYHHQYRKGSITASQWNKKHYLHDIFAMEIIATEVQKLTRSDNQLLINNKLKERVIESKIRYLWKLFLKKEYNELAILYHKPLLDLHDIEIAKKISKKMKKKVNIISLNNIFLWKIINLFYFFR